MQQIVHHLDPTGVAGFVLANGSMSSNQSGDGEIRKALVEADIVDCMVALPGQLFYSTPIPACLWFLARDRKNHRFRDRRGEVLFIDARKLAALVDRTHRELAPEEIARIAQTYHAWRGEKDAGAYADVAGFCRSAPLDEIRKHGHVLTPGRYVGAEAIEDDGEPFEEKMNRLAAQWREQQEEGARLDDGEFRRPGTSDTFGTVKPDLSAAPVQFVCEWIGWLENWTPPSCPTCLPTPRRSVGSSITPSAPPCRISTKGLFVPFLFIYLLVRNSGRFQRSSMPSTTRSI